jgi:hypothetical protein
MRRSWVRVPVLAVAPPLLAAQPRTAETAFGLKKLLDIPRPPVLMSLMLRKILSARGVIPVIMSFQIVPLLIFPPSSYSGRSQEWWLPALLTFLVIIALVQILIRKTRAPWPWYLVSFAQGVNIISRLMMFMPHATMNNAGRQEFNSLYVILAVVSMILSAFEIWYNDLPEVRRKIFSA